MTRCTSKIRDRSICRRNALPGTNKCWQHVNTNSRQRCKSGYRELYNGRCVRTHVTRGQRCSPGYRRNSAGQCISKRTPGRSQRARSPVPSMPDYDQSPRNDASANRRMREYIIRMKWEDRRRAEFEGYDPMPDSDYDELLSRYAAH
jgi:hypothetical protein